MGCGSGKSVAASQPQASKPGGVGPRAGVSSGSAPSKEVLASKLKQAQSTRVLALRESCLKALPAAVVSADGSNFRTVDLGINALTTLPEEIGSWTRLQNLLCPQNLLKELPSAIGRLESLQKFVLSSNQLRALPAELSRLGKLKFLHLDGNQLGPRLPDVFGGALAGSLEELHLGSNALEELAPSLGTMRELVRLTLDRNLLRSLEGLGGLTKLRYLDAGENKIVGVPSDLLQQTSLSELWLQGNPIDRLELQATPGFEDLLVRRKQRLDAKIDSNVVGKVDFAMCGLD